MFKKLVRLPQAGYGCRLVSRCPARTEAPPRLASLALQALAPGELSGVLGRLGYLCAGGGKAMFVVAADCTMLYGCCTALPEHRRPAAALIAVHSMTSTECGRQAASVHRHTVQGGEAPAATSI